MTYDKIKINKGYKTDLPTLESGELGICLDTKELFIGGLEGNIDVVKDNPSFNGHIDENTTQSDKNPHGTYTEFSQRGINVKWFGAKGDGITDDTSAIQATLDHIGLLGKGILLIPDGTYVITLTSSSWLKASSNTIIRGMGKNSVIKVKNNNGNYRTVFGPNATSETYNTVLTQNILFEALCVDQNITNNTSATITSGDSVDNDQKVIDFRNFSNINITNCTFDTCSGVNTIMLYSHTSDKVSVVNCHFVFESNPSNAWYDNTTVFVQCSNFYVAGNTFKTTLNGNLAYATTAIEGHKGPGIIEGNTVINYKVGAIVASASTADASTDENNIIAVNNSLFHVNKGIILWAEEDKTLDNVVVQGNSVSIAQVQHNQTSCQGIALSNLVSVLGDYANINISNNVINFQDEGTGRAGQTEGSIYGIGIVGAGGGKNIKVFNNQIINAPVRGVYCGYQSVLYENIQITHNQIVNAGQNLGVTQSSRVAIALVYNGVFKDIDVRYNTIREDLNPKRGYNAIYATTGTFTNVVIKDNDISSLQGDYRTDELHANIIKGNSFIKYSSTFPPVSGSYNIGDFIYNTATPVAGETFSLYRCTANGTAGTITGLTGTVDPTYNYLVTMTGDVSQLHVGDWIQLAGGASKKISHIAGQVVRVINTFAVVTDAVVTFTTPTLQPCARVEKYSTVAPASGTYLQGDIVYNSNPAAGGYIGWICITAGTPGAWKGFGLIEV